jgi:hypothetical protein
MDEKIGITSKGLYFRNLGRLEDSKTQPKFYLGRNCEVARTRNAQLEAVWEGAKRFWMDHVPGGDPCWDVATLEVARAVAKGDKIAYVSPPDPHDMDSAASFLDGIRLHMPIRVELRGQWPATNGQPQIQENRRTSQSLHAALADFKKEILGSDRLQPETAGTKSRDIAFLIEHIPDQDLRHFDTEAIESIIEKLRLRPVGKRKKQIAAKYASNLIKQFRAFIRWLNRSPKWFWKRPDDYEVIPVRIAKVSTDRKISAMTVPVYQLDELVTLWQYALPFDRLLICLGLNCAFGRREMATLTADEFHLQKRHPYASVLHIPESDSDSWIMRQRGKTGIYGEWKLWPITVKAIQWWLSHRPTCIAPELIVSDAGLPFKTTRGGHGNQKLANKWKALFLRIKKDIPGFRPLSINKLRKTSINLIQIISKDGEVASIHAAHGEYTADDLLKLYANRPFVKLHPALDALCQYLQPLWTAIVTPFPADQGKPKGGPNVSRGTINKIQKMAQQGYKHNHIAETLGVGLGTVARWIKRGKAGTTEATAGTDSLSTEASQISSPNADEKADEKIDRSA